MLTNIVKHNAQ